MLIQRTAQLYLCVNKVGLGTGQLYKVPVPAATLAIKGFAGVSLA